MNAFATPARTTERVGADRLLGIKEVAERTGFGSATASRIIDESGHAIVLHRRKFILESSLMDFLRSVEGGQHA